MELYAATIIKVTLLCLLIAVSPVRSSCTNSYDYETCSHTLECEGPITFNDWSYYVVRDVSECYHTIYSHGDEMEPIHMVLRELSELNIEEYFFQIIVSLDLSYNHLENDYYIPRLPNLDKLILSNNYFTDLKLSTGYDFPALRQVDLSHNFIETPTYLLSFTKLKNINLSHNNLRQIPIFNSFTDLEDLDLSYNSISEMGPITFEGVMNLVNLNLSNNQITDINSSLFRFRKLKSLKLKNNKITTIQSHEFRMLMQLESLDLSNNLISNLETLAFSQLVELSDLDLSNNEIRLLDKNSFTNTNNIKRINLSMNKIIILPTSTFKNNNLLEFSIEKNELEGSVVRGMFDGLQLIDTLDLSNQHLASIEDYAFYNLENLETLLLQNNEIQNLTTKCFATLKKLTTLDLSFNQITELVFETHDLLSLESLSLKYNLLTSVKYEYFKELSSLQFLDISNNKIKAIEPRAFRYLKDLINFDISNNSLDGVKDGTFEGLNSLPKLDISSSFITYIQNQSFNGMAQLVELDISHSHVKVVQFNAFINTSSLHTIDLSYNNLTDFYVNASNIPHIVRLYLNNNYIKTFYTVLFQTFVDLSELNLSFNKLENMQNVTLSNLENLSVLDISYNDKFNLDTHVIHNLKSIDVLSLSGIKNEISFDNIDLPVSQLLLCDTMITDVNSLHLSYLNNLKNLELSRNKIAKLEYIGFANLTKLKAVDVSNNNISYIQPGTFKDNNMLILLNVSHNSLTVLSYGMFRGLTNLNILDVSFNFISNIEKERFYETSSLKTLIVDHNKIKSIDFKNFIGTQLSLLSIGHNPIPCDALVKFQEIERDSNFKITAAQLDYHSDENIHGIICNKKLSTSKSNIFNNTDTVGFSRESESILLNIRDILLNKLKNKSNDEPNKDNLKYILNITQQFDRSISNDEKLNSNVNNLSSILNNVNFDIKFLNSYFVNLTQQSSQIIDKGNKTNMLLERILKIMTVNTTPAPKPNVTNDILLQYMNNMKLRMENILTNEKTKTLNDINNSVSNSNTYWKNSHRSNSLDVPIIFIAACVGFISLIIVGLIINKLYKNTFYKKRTSGLNRDLSSVMDSTF